MEGRRSYYNNNCSIFYSRTFLLCWSYGGRDGGRAERGWGSGVKVDYGRGACGMVEGLYKYSISLFGISLQ